MITSCCEQLRETISPYLPEKAGAFEKFQCDPVGYAEQILGLTPWAGCNGNPGQRELFEDIGASVEKQLRGEVAPRIFRVEAGNGVGKTYGVAMLVNWFFDAFAPSITYTTAPSKEQVENLLWKNIKALRPSHLPGRVLPAEPRMLKAPNHFAVGKTTSDSGGKGEERFKGQHDKYLLFVLDEAEGVPKFVFDAIHRMMTGGTVILVLIIGNPRTRTSEFYKWGKKSGVKNYRLSVLDHPNVVTGTDRVEGATSRDWVIGNVHEWCDVQDEHDVDNYTFTLPYDIPPDPEDLSKAHGAAGTIFLPNADFLTSVLGIAPANVGNMAFVSPGRYENALKNAPLPGEEKRARIGIDCARYGKDFGTIYVRHAGKCWRAATISGVQVEMQGGLIYYTLAKKIALELAEKGVESLHFRIDGSGGWGSTAIDNLKADADLKLVFEDYKVIEVNFSSSARNAKRYANIITECYAEAAETLRGLRLERVPAELEGDLTERMYFPVNRQGLTLIALEEKDAFRKRIEPSRSPDDGDGFVLAAAPDHILNLSWAHDPEAWKMLHQEMNSPPAEKKPASLGWTQGH